MTVLSRGARPRRGSRRPGWLLLTVLLVLAIVASSALVFTDRVELLKLAVILALWAAVVAAFVSVIYRRQSDVDAARARDLKLVYDLQLDREISARREYELTVESQLRRELASELRAQAADEVAALRAELAALRTNLEILFGADLEDRPAIERDRAARSVGRGRPQEPAQRPTPDRVVSSRVSPVREDDTTRTAESPIIDVAEEPGFRPPPYSGSHRRVNEPESRPEKVDQPQPQPQPPRQRRQPPAPQTPPPPPVAQPAPAPPAPQPAPEPVMSVPPTPVHVPEPPAPPVQEHPVMATPPPPPPPPQPTPPAPERRGRHAPQANSSQPNSDWRPAPAEGQWIPAGAPGSNWVSRDVQPRPEPPTPPPTPTPAPAPPEPAPEPNGVNGYVGRRRAPEPEPAPEPRRGRHGRPAEPPPSSPPQAQEPSERRSRHSVPPAEAAQPGPTPPAPEPAPDSDSQHAEGQSVADLMARLQVASQGGGRRRRRED